MQRNIFSPRVKGLSDDFLSSFFRKITQYVMIGLFGLLPIFFIPNIYTSLGLMKSFFVIVGIYVALIFSALAILRSGKVRLIFPAPLLLFWAFSITALASALLSQDIFDSVYGTAFDSHSASFLVLMASIMTLSLVFVNQKTAIAKLLTVALGAVALVYAFTFLRLFLGADFLSFGIFTTNTVSLVGSLNDLALYASLVLLIVLMISYRLPSTKVVQLGVLILSILSLFILALVNFSFIWLAVGFCSLLSFLYLLSRDTWLASNVPQEVAIEKNLVSRITLFTVALICLTSGAFVVSGDYLGAKLAQVTGVSYVEVRPSTTATIAIVKNVFAENALFGFGPNRFEDAWRIFKDPVINQTKFWNTPFASGSSFFSTILVTTGLAGLVFFLAFIGTFTYTAGYKIFFSKQLEPDAGWQFVGSVAFIAAAYLWVMAFVYSPGTFIMLLTALMTGLCIAISVTLTPGTDRVLNLADSRHHGLIIMAGVIVVIVASTYLFIAANKQLVAEVLYTEGGKEFAVNQNVPAYDEMLSRVSQLSSNNDRYVAERARLRLAELNRLLALSQPSSDEQKKFEALFVEGVAFVEQALLKDQTNPYNYALLASFYGLINPSLYEGVKERREAAFTEALRLDPTNPEYYVLKAQIVGRLGEIDEARNQLNEAIALKRDYTDALYLSSQLDIQLGNATSAIATTKSIIAIEPNNPGRYFQLGLLLVATNNLNEAIAPLLSAITLDPNYANARYVLALAYLDLGQEEEALSHLKTVELSNGNNEELRALIEQVSAGKYEGQTPDASTLNLESSQVDVVSASDVADTNLVTPVNEIGEAVNDAVEVSEESSQEEF